MSDALPTPEEPTPLDGIDLAGYGSVPELVAGYRASGAEAKRQRERADQMEQLAQTLLVNASQPRQDVPDRNGYGEGASEPGIPISEFDDHVARGLDSRLTAAVEARVNQVFAPIWTSIVARRKVMARNPDYGTFEAAVWDHVRSDPERLREYETTFARDPESAMTIAMLRFTQAEQQRHQQRASSNGSVDASIPSMRSGDGRRPIDNQQDLRDAFERFQKTGSSRDAQAYARAGLRTVISEEFLNG